MAQGPPATRSDASAPSTSTAAASQHAAGVSAAARGLFDGPRPGDMSFQRLWGSFTSYASAAVYSSPFSFLDPVLEQRYLEGAYGSVVTATQYILIIELIIHLILVGDIIRAARGRPVLEAQLCLAFGIAAMLGALVLLHRAPGVLRLYRIPINCFFRVSLTLGYTQVRYVFPWLLHEKKAGNPQAEFFDRVFVRSFAAVVAVVGNLPLPFGLHVGTHVIMLGILVAWDGWYCCHILRLPDVATQLGSMAVSLVPNLETFIQYFFPVPWWTLPGPSLEGPQAERVTCATQLALLQICASFVGTMGYLTADCWRRRGFLAAHVAAVRSRGEDLVPDERYRLHMSELRVSVERFAQVLVVVTCGYSGFWLLCQSSLHSTEPPFWANPLRPNLCDLLCRVSGAGSPPPEAACV